jgi:hypothetical protein
VTRDERIPGLKDAMAVLSARMLKLADAKPHTKAWRERRGLEKALALLSWRKCELQPMQILKDANCPRGVMYLVDEEPLTKRFEAP